MEYEMLMDDKKDLSHYDTFLVTVNYKGGKPIVKYKLIGQESLTKGLQ